MWRRLAFAVIPAFAVLFGNARASSVVQQEPTLADIRLIQAWYGDPATTGLDVTAIVRDALARRDSIRATAGLFTDSAVNHHKVLWLKYTLRGNERTYYVPDDQTLLFSSLLDEVPAPGTYQLVSANYQGVDVSRQVGIMLSQAVVAVPVSMSAFQVSDPAMGQEKTLKLTFRLEDGDMKVLTGHEGATLSLKALLPLKELPEVVNGSFNSTDTSSFASDLTYVPASDNALAQAGTFTISQGILRPFQLHHSIRADLLEHSGRDGSMAMWINPAPGRQPVLLWEEKVAVQPETDYVFSCSVVDISDAESLFATIVLEVDGARTKPLVIEDIFRWHDLHLLVHSRDKKSVRLKVWRDVLPYGADGAAALGLDDIRFGPAPSKS